MISRSLSVASSLILVACAGDVPTFDWSPDLYAADSRTQSIVRQSDSGTVEQIFTNDARFDDMICMPKDEPRKALEMCNAIILKCEKWK